MLNKNYLEIHRCRIIRSSNVQKIAIIKEVLEKDGGDVELVDVNWRNAIVSLKGTCTGCLMADVTLNNIDKTEIAGKC